MDLWVHCVDCFSLSPESNFCPSTITSSNLYCAYLSIGTILFILFFFFLPSRTSRAALNRIHLAAPFQNSLVLRTILRSNAVTGHQHHLKKEPAGLFVNRSYLGTLDAFPGRPQVLTSTTGQRLTCAFHHATEGRSTTDLALGPAHLQFAVDPLRPPPDLAQSFCGLIFPPPRHTCWQQNTKLATLLYVNILRRSLFFFLLALWACRNITHLTRPRCHVVHRLCLIEYHYRFGLANPTARFDFQCIKLQ